ncbi:hypothetical protein MBOT_05880 [Mycobacterium botniense]|uniref:Uncharacterized protein n=1 Tax=Mycobacterium botniense TaxID=84962 RepID=A0A7I9XT99_9MYCO|nr:hypothetical protein MBOT_05880 [Mycobacterium botniense]
MVAEYPQRILTNGHLPLFSGKAEQVSFNIRESSVLEFGSAQVQIEPAGTCICGFATLVKTLGGGVSEVPRAALVARHKYEAVERLMMEITSYGD